VLYCFVSVTRRCDISRRIKRAAGVAQLHQKFFFKNGSGRMPL
jgi:hypothetical protein